jgi:ketosteroid isomerase-like protein
MSQENVEAFHRIQEVWFRDHRVGPELLAKNVEWVNPSDAVEGGTRRGIESFNKAVRSIFDVWDEVRFEIERIIDNGDEVIALGQVRGRGRAAGVEVVRPHGEIWTFRNGRATRVRWFHSNSETLQAAGLSE